ncbi:MAG: extracellular solute-binding protein [Chloroflexi bacterium]|nr:extracellular solute-binding protein [Chloroflexota bacterium]
MMPEHLATLPTSHVGRRTRRALHSSAVRLGTAVTAATAIGCNPLPWPSSEPAPSSQPVVLDYWDAQSGGPIITPLIQRFQEQNPRFTVNVTSMSQTESLDKFLAGFAAGTAPDVWKSTLVYNADFAARKASANLEPYARSIKNDLLPLALEEGRRYKNTLYNVPSEMDVYLQYYHGDLFTRSALKPPDTFDQLVEVGQRFLRLGTPDEPVWTIQVTGARGGHFQNLMICMSWNGAGVRNGLFDDKGNCLLTTAASVNGYQFWGDLLHRHRIAPPPNTTGVSIASGRLATQWSFLSTIAGLDRNPGPDKYGTAKPPAGPKGRFVPWGANGWMMYSGTKHPTDAWQLIAYLVSPEVDGAFCEARGVMPSNAKAYQQSWLQRPAYRPAVELLQTPQQMLLIPTWLPEWSTFVTEIAVQRNQKFLAGELPARQALEEMAAFLNAAQKKYLAA